MVNVHDLKVATVAQTQTDTRNDPYIPRQIEAAKKLLTTIDTELLRQLGIHNQAMVLATQIRHDDLVCALTGRGLRFGKMPHAWGAELIDLDATVLVQGTVDISLEEAAVLMCHYHNIHPAGALEQRLKKAIGDIEQKMLPKNDKERALLAAIREIEAYLTKQETKARLRRLALRPLGAPNRCIWEGDWEGVRNTITITASCFVIEETTCETLVPSPCSLELLVALTTNPQRPEPLTANDLIAKIDGILKKA